MLNSIEENFPNSYNWGFLIMKYDLVVFATKL